VLLQALDAFLSTQSHQPSKNPFPKLFRVPDHFWEAKPRHVGKHCFHFGSRQLMIRPEQESTFLYVGYGGIGGATMVGQVGQVPSLRGCLEMLVEILGRSPPRFVLE